MDQTVERARTLLQSAIVCDAILPWTPYGRTELRNATLPRYAAAGFGMVSLSLCSDAEGLEAVLQLLAKTRREIQANEALALVGSVADIRSAREAGRLAVALNLQGTRNLGGNLDLLELYYALGIRQITLVYNYKSAVGDGCHERTDGGLSRYGLDLVRAMNNAGILVDVSHSGRRTSLDVIDGSEAPVIFSHSNPKALWKHDRNIDDEQAKACAARGGWIGAVGVGIFMGEDDSSTETYFRQIDHWAQLVGPEHVGLGTDYVYDSESMQAYMRSVKSPESGNYDRMTAFVQPEQMPALVERMLTAGYSDSAILGILGGNYLRIAAQIWR